MKSPLLVGTLAICLAAPAAQTAAPKPAQPSAPPPQQAPATPEPTGGAPELQARPPLAAKPPAVPEKPAANPGSASPATEAEFKPFVVMINAKLEGNPVIGAGVIFAHRNDRLYIATANHVVRAATLTDEPVTADDVRVQLAWLPGESFPARLLTTFDATLDLAVLAVTDASRLAVPQLPWAVLVRPEQLSAGEKVVPIGNPLGRSWFVPRQPHLVSNVNAQTIQSEGQLQRGNSGGALTTEDWGIAGIVLRESPQLSDTTRIDLVVQKLRQWEYPVDATFREHASAPAGITATDPARDRQAAGKLAADWVNAMITKNFSTIMASVEAPFYFDQVVLASREEVEQRFRQLFAEERRDEGTLSIHSINARTIAEAKKEGRDLTRDRAFKGIDIDDRDWVVLVTVGVLGRGSPEGTLFYMRKIDGVLKVIGFWN